MKAKFRPLVLSVFFVLITFAFSFSCTKDPTTTCVTSTGCLGKSFKTCAGVSGGYYEYNGVKYEYTLTNITSAATRLNTAMGCK